MTEKEAKKIVKDKYPRSICRYYEGKGFAVQSYRCGCPVTNKEETSLYGFSRKIPVTSETKLGAWVSAAVAVREGKDGNLPV